MSQELGNRASWVAYCSFTLAGAEITEPKSLEMVIV